ncbi:uncharacterized protein N7503_004469 [Penicillium pulvis]|uniref:uncharacterized protein n=1 Tax=Penicillium pulvis TaxID=1562058 RepID=UPI0025473A6D|nr:uncharacterized protein N7503_004469 [Penicillium pulvis]KAJ5802019.1 hypothetical protein N7503_004469 [Penicillium pulvis]
MSSTSLQLHGCFSPSLPGHPAWNLLRPILNATNCLGEGRNPVTATGLRSSLSVEFDFYFVAFDSSSSQSTELNILLLSPACLKSTREATIGKIQKLQQSSDSNPIPTAIVFLFEDGYSLRQSDGTWWLNELMGLEALMVQYVPQACPILPISDTTKFLDFIRSLMERKFTLRTLPPLCAEKPLQILTRMTKSGTQANEANPGNILTCLYSSLRDVSQAKNSDQITDLLHTYLGVKYDGHNIADFLREDSKVD